MIELFLMSNGSSVRRVSFRTQSTFSDTCRQFCLYFLINRCSGRTFNEILADFSLTNLEIFEKIIFIKVLKTSKGFIECERYSRTKNLKRLLFILFSIF